MKVAVLGAGYAGVTATRALEDSLPNAVDIVVVTDEPTHLVRHEVHRVLRDPAFADEIRVPLADLFDRADVIVDRVTDVDADAGRVELAEGELTYDYGIVALGAETAFHDLPGVETHGLPLRTVEHARQVRDRFLECLAEGSARVVVGGAGLSGIQIAGELATLAAERNTSEDVDIQLLERLDSVAPGFATALQSALRDALEARGIAIRTEEAVTAVTAERITTESREIDYDLLVWTGGIRGPAATGGDRVTVRSDLRIGETTFVAGDAGRLIDATGEVVPASAQAAIASADVAATNVARLVEGGDGPFDPRLERLSFSPRAWVVSVGDGAVAQVGPTILTGSAALAVKATAGVGYLSSVGAVERAIEVAREEFGAG